MQLRYQTASPHCRKTLAALRIRRDDVEIIETSDTTDRRALLHAEPLLTTERGAFTSAASILAELESHRRVLLPARIEDQVGALDRMLDLYLLEPALTMAAEPRTPASVGAVYTVMRALDLVADRLSDGRRFLLGDTLTLADLTAVIGATDAGRQGVPLPRSIAAYPRRAALIQPIGEIVAEADAWFALVEAAEAGRTALAA